MRQTINVIITPAVTATLEYWPAPAASRTLLLYTHGMQNPVHLEPPPSLPPKNYAFTIPFNYALFNPEFTASDSIDNLQIFTETFIEFAARFTSRTPQLYIYPYLFPQAPRIDDALDALDAHGVCDLMYLTDLTIGSDYIRLEQLVAAPHPAGGTFHTAYDSFFLLACRSSTAGRVIGFGGAPSTGPDGLYKGDDSFIIRW